MIIESSFYRLSEILFHFESLKDSDAAVYNSRIYEATLSHFFSMSIMSEFQIRNSPNPLLRIHGEVSYPSIKDKACDLWISLKDIYDTNYAEKYDIRDENYCEMKFYFGKNLPVNQAQATTENIGYILNDLSRLIHHVPKDCGKYFLVFFDTDKWEYLGKDEIYRNTRRGWLEDLFRPGYKQIEFDVTNEENSITKNISTGQFKYKMDLNVLELNTLPANKSFNGYLIKILNSVNL